MKPASGGTPAKQGNETLGLLLVRADKITRAQLYEALREQRQTGNRLGDILFDKGWIGEEELTLLIAKQLGIPFVETGALSKIPKGLIDKFPAKVAEEFRCLPVHFWKGKLTVAMDDQKTRDYVDEISFLTGSNCAPALAAPRALLEAIERYYGITLEPKPRGDAAGASGGQAAVPASELVRDRPTGKMEALPVSKKDERGRETVSAKNASGEDVVYLLTDVTAAPPEFAVVEDDDDAPSPATAPEAPADEDRHDNFLAPETDEDDGPVWRPKGSLRSAPVRSEKPATSALAATGGLAEPPANPPEPSPGPSPMPEPAESGAPVPEFDIVRAAERLFEATDPNGIGEVIVTFARHLLDRAILFDVTGSRYRVLAGAASLPEDDRATEFSASPEELVLLGVVARTMQPAYGPTPTGEMYERFFDRLGLLKPPNIMLYPLVVAGKTRAVLFGGLGDLRSAEDFGDLQLLFKEAATAFEILDG